MAKKVKGWKKRLLWQVGKEVLIKSVLQAIRTYAMQCFLIPKGVCDEISSLIRSFWWGKDEQNRGISWKNWEFLCKPKGEGGMGFWELEAFNFALLAKQGSGILKNPTSLVARVLVAKYHPN